MKKEDNKFEEYHLELHNWKAVHSGLSQGHYESKCCNVLGPYTTSSHVKQHFVLKKSTVFL